MRWRASWYARASHDGVLRTVGVLIEGDSSIKLWSLRGDDDPVIRTVNVALSQSFVSGMTPADAFDLLTEGGGNGQTEEWSEPFTVHAPSARTAAEKVLKQHLADQAVR